MKAFKTAAKSKTAAKKRRENTISFELDGIEYSAHAPKDAAYVMLAASADGDKSGMSSAIEITHFLEGVLSKEDVTKITARLRDPEDAFDLAGLVEIFNYLISEFVGRPTGSQSA